MHGRSEIALIIATNSRLGKLLRLAFDAGATDAEAEQAGVQAVREARREGVRYTDIFMPVVTQPKPKTAPHDDDPFRWRSAELRTRMPFGRHKGRTLGWIGENDFGYLRWLAEEADIHDHRLGRAIDAAYAYAGGDA